MTVYIGVDFHPYEQSVVYASDEDGKIGYRRFLHSDKQSILPVAALSFLREMPTLYEASRRTTIAHPKCPDFGMFWREVNMSQSHVCRRAQLVHWVRLPVSEREPCRVFLLQRR
jgi:hypothetical protein